MKINIIVAYDNNRCIGKNGKIPWKIKGEQKQFKELTTNNIVIMGRKTYEEIGKPLPNRDNIVITSHKIDEVICCRSLGEALTIACKELDRVNGKDIYIIGGAKLYKEAMDTITIDNYYITKIKQCTVCGDAFFPKFKESLYDAEVLEENKDFIRYHYSRKRVRL